MSNFERILHHSLILISTSLLLWVATPASAQTAPATETPYISVNVDQPMTQLGQVLRYEITFQNPQPTPLGNVTISNTFDARLVGVQVAAATMGQPTVVGNTVTLSDVTLQPGESGNLVITGQIANDVIPGEVISNVAVLEAPQAPPQLSNTVSTTIIPATLPTTGESPYTLWRYVIGFAVLGSWLGALTLLQQRRNAVHT